VGEVQQPKDNDSRQHAQLPETTAQNFQIAEASADKGYAGRGNIEVIASKGATPYISFAAHHRGNGGGKWAEMYHCFQFKREEFLQHYHKRSNVESTFSMMKRK